jgi:aldehyde dehydrogenase (NAD+)
MAIATLPRSEALAPTAYEGFEKMLIRGRWRQGRGDVLEDRDPYSNELLLKIHQADKVDLEEAFRAAEEALPKWQDTPPGERSAMLLRAATIMEARRAEIVDWLIRESGSTRIKANLEWQFSHAMTLEAASFPSRATGRIMPIDQRGKDSYVFRRPVGVVGMISPWNFPLHLSNRSVAPALALGNTAVVKPSSDTPVTGGLLLAKMYEEAGLPNGVLNVIVGTGSEIGDAFVQHPASRVISFTGSTAVGKRIAELAAKAPILKKVALELGGNSPLVVLDDADMATAVAAAVFGKFLHQGQICMAVNRIIVDAKIHDDFLDCFTHKVRSLKVGNPADHDTFVGPVMNKSQLTKILKLITRARDENARELLGGEPKGLVLPPHVFADVTNNMTIAKEELFGPVASIIKVANEEKALEVANATPYGLSAAVITRDCERGLKFAVRLQAGMSHVNDSPVNDLPNCPFGGEKNSGLGRYNGDWAIDEFTTVHWITVQHGRPQYNF